MNGAVTRYWKRCRIASLVTISSGRGIPESVVMVRTVPSTWASAIPGNQSAIVAGSPSTDHTSSTGRSTMTSRRTVPIYCRPISARSALAAPSGDALTSWMSTRSSRPANANASS